MEQFAEIMKSMAIQQQEDRKERQEERQRFREEEDRRRTREEEKEAQRRDEDDQRKRREEQREAQRERREEERETRHREEEAQKEEQRRQERAQDREDHIRWRERQNEEKRLPKPTMKITPYQEGEDILTYFEKYEQMLMMHEVPEDHWHRYWPETIGGQLRSACKTVDLSTASYPEIKDAVLKFCGVTPVSQRIRLRAIRYYKQNNPEEYLQKVDNLLEGWMHDKPERSQMFGHSLSRLQSMECRRTWVSGFRRKNQRVRMRLLYLCTNI